MLSYPLQHKNSCIIKTILYILEDTHKGLSKQLVFIENLLYSKYDACERGIKS